MTRSDVVVENVSLPGTAYRRDSLGFSESQGYRTDIIESGIATMEDLVANANAGPASWPTDATLQRAYSEVIAIGGGQGIRVDVYKGLTIPDIPTKRLTAPVSSVAPFVYTVTRFLNAGGLHVTADGSNKAPKDSTGRFVSMKIEAHGAKLFVDSWRTSAPSMSDEGVGSWSTNPPYVDVACRVLADDIKEYKVTTSKSVWKVTEIWEYRETWYDHFINAAGKVDRVLIGDPDGTRGAPPAIP